METRGKSDIVGISMFCYLCGCELTSQNGTRDHVFPKCLFPAPRPHNLPTLPACRTCNEATSRNEEVFRIFLTCGMAVETDAGRRVWDESVRRDLQGKRHGLKTLIRSMTKIAKVMTDSGSLLGNIGILSVDREVVNNVFRKIAKGLYCLDTGRPLPRDVETLIGSAAEKRGLLNPPFDGVLRGARKVDLGNGVVTYWRATIPDDPAGSITWLRFYDDKLFVVVTSRKDATE